MVRWHISTQLAGKIPLIYALIIPLTTIDVSQFLGGENFWKTFGCFFTKMRWEIRHLEVVVGPFLGGRLDSTNHRKTNDTFQHSRFYGKMVSFRIQDMSALNIPNNMWNLHRGSWILWPKHPWYAAAKTVAVSLGGSKQI